MICDRIVVKIREQGLSEKLQMDENLTLENTKRKVRQCEAVQKQQEILKGGPKTEAVVDSVHSRKNKPPSGRKTQGQPQSRFASNGKCTRCGKSPHARQACPAKEAVCHRCKKKGHYKAQCMSKGVEEVAITSISTEEQQEVPRDDIAYLNTVYKNSSNSWNCQVTVNGIAISFKLDTGAEVTVITEKTAEDLNAKHLMANSKKKLFGADRKKLTLLGKMSCTLEYGSKSTTQELFVVKQLNQNLLGLPTIEALKMIKQVEAVSNTIHDSFPSLFNGLGTLQGGEYEIKIKPGAKPFALFTVRHVPFPL